MTFKDRVANKPNRIKITYEEGGNSVYATVELADEPIEEGTALNAVNMNKMLNKEDNDYIVEQGTSGIWTYRKWNSGVAECWGSLSVKTAIKTAWTTGMFISSAFPENTTDFPLDFTEVPSVVASANAAYSVFLMDGGVPHTRTTLGNYQFARPLSLKDELNYSVSINVKGRWK